jgi:hypothetical protein
MYASPQVPPPATEIRANITAVASEIHLIVFSAGQDNGVEEGAKFQITRGGEVTGTGVVGKVTPKWSAGRILESNWSFRAGDEVRIDASR